MRTRLTLVSCVSIGAAVILATAPGAGRPGQPVYTTDFGIERCRQLVPDGGNDYFTLEPGAFRRLEGVDEEGFKVVEITVLDETRVVAFRLDHQPQARLIAVTRVVEEREWIDGALAEVSRNYYARCPSSNNVFYFGEDVDLYENGKVVGHDGSWLAGVDGAQPGLAMPGLFLLGARYHQEIVPGVAMDRAEHLAMGLRIRTLAGVFDDCVMVMDSSPLESDDEDETIKLYGPGGIGTIIDGPLELVAYE